MTNLFLVSAGLLGAIISVAHFAIGEKTLISPLYQSKTLPMRANRILRAIFALSAIYWLVGAIALIYGAVYFPTDVQFVIACVVGIMYLSGALANFWATRGRHFGWAILLFTTFIIWLGIS